MLLSAEVFNRGDALLLGLQGGAQTGLSQPWPPCARRVSDGEPEQGGKGLCTYYSCVGVGNTECNTGFHSCKLSGFFFLTVLPHRPRRYGRSMAPSSARRDLMSLATIAYGSSEI